METPFPEKILIYSPKTHAFGIFRQLFEEEYSPVRVEVNCFSSLSDILARLGEYYNGIVFDGEQKDRQQIIEECSQIRNMYQGRLVLWKDSEEYDVDEWGFLAKVSACKRTIEELILYLHQKALKTKKRGRLAIVCSGGGILGGYYEVGCLKALSALGLSQKFDLYVGTSAGSFVLACVVNQVSIEQMIHHRGMGWMHYYYLNFEEYFQKITKALIAPSKKLFSLFTSSLSPNGKNPEADLDQIFKFSQLFPTAMLDPSRISRYLETVILEVGGTIRFDKLRERGKELYITAVDIDKSKTVVFGDPGERVSIPEAVEASIAIPGIYRSKDIDGRYCSDGGIKKNADLDTAIKKGADLIFVIHPLVPYTGGQPGFIHKLGPFGYLEQTYRTILTKNLNDSINLHKYLNPHVTVLRVTPNSDDPRNFRNVLSASPDKIKDNIQRGYEDTLRRIRVNADFLSRAFHHHGYKETDFAQAIAQIGNSPFNGKTPINVYP